jgi:SAM-dependent methyltransferase
MIRRWRQASMPTEVESDPPTVGAEVDVATLLGRYSIDELSQSAEEYFSRMESWDAALSKPFYSMHEAPELLAGTGALLQSLELKHGQTVLDFGAGSGWLSWMLAQLGCRVISSDVSTTALRITEERFRRFPPIGQAYPATLSHFGGRRIDLEDGSVDRVACNDAFHHVPNPAQVLAEFARILTPGGICVLVEPGPNHSKSPQSQFEMRNFRVVERDIIVEDIAAQALAAGFESAQVGVYCGLPRFVDANSFGTSISSDSPLPNEMTRGFLENRRLIKLGKPGTRVVDSRTRSGLLANLEVGLTGRTIHARVENQGAATWIQAVGAVGYVNLGAHLYRRDGQLVSFDFLRLPLRDSDEAIPPGTTVEVVASLPDTAPGEYRIEFDLVAENVAWFAENGSTPVTVDL